MQTTHTAALAPAIRTRIEGILSENPVVLFMKGSPESPMCGFSAKVVTILKHLGTSYATLDILQDDELREGLKLFADWPTYPQLYVQGELLGGADILGEMFQSGELAGLLKPYHHA
jgi:monothiol glutaredoxin